MIEIAKEKVFPLSIVPRLRNLPRRRQRRKLHVATCYRWAKQGVRGVRLETIRVGGTLCTSLNAQIVDNETVPVTVYNGSLSAMTAQNLKQSAGSATWNTTDSGTYTFSVSLPAEPESFTASS